MDVVGTGSGFDGSAWGDGRDGWCLNIFVTSGKWYPPIVIPPEVFPDSESVRIVVN